MTDLALDLGQDGNGGGGSGTVVGPVSSVNNELALFSGTGGQTLKGGTGITSVGGRLSGLVDPASGQDAATKAYVDALAQGLDPKQSVRLVSLTSLPLSGLSAIDGVTPIAGDRIGALGQTASQDSGIYVAAAGAWARASDANTSAKVTSGMFFFATEGTANGDKSYVLTTDDPIVLGTTPLTFVRFSSFAISGAAPLMDGAASPGSLGSASDAGHVHPRDTSKSDVETITSVKTANYAAQFGELVLCDTSGGAFTVTLPDATLATPTNRRVRVKRIAGSITVATATTAGQTINGSGAGSYSLSASTLPTGGLEVVSDGANWIAPNFMAVSTAQPAALGGAASPGTNLSSAAGLLHVHDTTALQTFAFARAAATTNVTPMSGPQTVDGVSLIAGNVALLTGQTTASQNGLWNVNAGAWTRVVTPMVSGLVISVSEGSANAGTLWRLATANPITAGTTSLVFVNDLSAPNGAFLWTWATAAARAAQSVSAAQIGAEGFQADMQLAYRLRSVSPTVWERLEDTTYGEWKRVVASATAGLSAVGCAWGTMNVGSIANRAVGTGSKSASLPRQSMTTAAATAGSTFYSRAGATQHADPTRGYRLRGKFVLGAVTPNMKWFVGVANTLGAPSTVLTPQAQIQSLLFGRDTEANIQMYHNDVSGTAVPVDCGAAFPAATALTGFDFEFLINVGGASGAAQITNLDTGAVFSASFTSDIPENTSLMLPCIYGTNGTDAVSIAADCAWFGYQTKE